MNTAYDRAAYQRAAENRDNGIGWTAIDTDTALTMWLSNGYSATMFDMIMADSTYRTFRNCSGITHKRENTIDHYWRLVCVNGSWYFAIVD